MTEPSRSYRRNNRSRGARLSWGYLGDVCMGRYWSSGHETWVGNSQTKMMDFRLPRLIIEAWVMLGYVEMGSLQNSKRSSGWLQGGSDVLHRIFLCFISDQRCGLHKSMMNCVPATPISCYTDDIIQTGCFTTKYWERGGCFVLLFCSHPSQNWLEAHFIFLNIVTVFAFIWV